RREALRSPGKSVKRVSKDFCSSSKATPRPCRLCRFCSCDGTLGIGGWASDSRTYNFIWIRRISDLNAICSVRPLSTDEHSNVNWRFRHDAPLLFDSGVARRSANGWVGSAALRVIAVWGLAKADRSAAFSIELLLRIRDRRRAGHLPKSLSKTHKRDEMKLATRLELQ